MNHWTRHSGDPDQERYTYRNVNIDKSRTALNYALLCAHDEYDAVMHKIKQLNDSVERKPTKATNVVSSAIVTLPGSWPAGRDPREFFEAAADALAAQVGRDNVIGGFVHMDEMTPHMHFAFVARARVQRMTNDKSRPLRWTKADERKNPEHKAGEIKHDKKGTARYERVTAVDAEGRPVTETAVAQSAMFDRAHMKGWHQETEDAIETRLGFRIPLLLSDDARLEKALSKVPHDKLQAATDAARAEVERAAEAALKAAKDELGKTGMAIDDATRRKKAVEAEVEKGSQRLESLQREVGRAEEEAASLERERGGEEDERRRIEVERGERGADEAERRVREARGAVKALRARVEGFRGALRAKVAVLATLALPWAHRRRVTRAAVSCGLRDPFDLERRRAFWRGARYDTTRQPIPARETRER